MRMSCNGCRVLRKGCSEDCSIRPCLHWIKTPEAQANATVFLAKFYGRAGLINLLSAAPDHLRPAVFRSLLYEACGRIVNPIYGSVGLLWSGSWQMCQAAVEAVLTGAPIAQIPSETAAAAAAPVPVPAPPLKPYDIRHVAKDRSDGPSSPDSLRRVSKPRTRFKRSAKPKPKPTPNPLPVPADAAALCNLSYESSGSHAAEASGGENESAFSIETSSHVSQGEPDDYPDAMGLELTLGHEPASRAESRPRPAAEARRCDVGGWRDDTCRVELGLELPV